MILLVANSILARFTVVRAEKDPEEEGVSIFVAIVLSRHDTSKVSSSILDRSINRGKYIREYFNYF